MSEHYYTQNPTSRHDVKRLNITLDGKVLSFDTDAGVFLRGELDAGTELMIKSLPELNGTALDLGCGWGALGLFVKARNPGLNITLADINERAVELSRKNALLNNIECEAVCSDGFSGIAGTFDVILTNPPIRAGKRVIYDMFLKAREHLSASGALYIVIQTKQGADSALKFLRENYADADIIARGGGFKVIRALMSSACED